MFEESLVLPTQRCETLCKLICELCDILVRIVNHGCVSEEQKWWCGSESLGRDQLRLRGKEAALSGEGRIGG